jgi:hypothetical protein
MNPVELVLSKLPSAKRNGQGWHARCPAHDDRRASLSIAEGDDGRALLHCHAGCEPDAICGAIQLRPADLFPEASTPSTVYANGQKPERRRNTVDKPLSKSSGPTFTTAREAIAELERRNGTRSASWTYHNAEGTPCGVIVRWDRPDGKEVRPAALIGDRWTLVGMPEPRPLYGLPDVLKAETVYVTEGEKAADAVQSLGLTATTSAHGAKAAEKTDWTPLAGKAVVILPDNDEPGRDYADRAAAILGKLTPRPTVKIVELPGLPAKGDAVEWIEAQGVQTPEVIRNELERLAHDAEAIEPDRPAEPLRFVPFPMATLPRVVAGIVKRAARSIGCDLSFIALPLLTVFASAIGTTRYVRAKRSWTEPPILWTALVGESGGYKTPAFRFALTPLRRRQSLAFDAASERQAEHDAAVLRYDAELSEWKRRKCVGDPPSKPQPPEAERYIVSDPTVEALAPILRSNPRGVLLARDELSGWFGSFNAYGGGKSKGDEAQWLSAHNAESILVDRKTGAERTINVPMAAVAIAGGIQPGILRRTLGRAHRESGLAARLLLTMPPRTPRRWTDDEPDEGDEAALAAIVDRLFTLEHRNDDGKPSSVLIGLSPEAKRLWVAFVNDHGNEQAELSGDLAAAWSKLEAYGLRLALVLQFVGWACGGPTDEEPSAIDAATMQAAIELTRWFANEARRVYALLDESDDDGMARELVEWIERRGGRVTVRELQQHNRRYKPTGAAEKAIGELINAGYGSWEPPTGQGGRPARRFILSTQSPVYGTGAKPEDNGHSVDVDNVDATNERGEWGEV